MSGHSKWSKVKHQKATTDVVKSFAFTKASRAIAVAVKEGGGITDPESNFHLRLAIEKAHDVNMPKENIERAIEKAGGSGALAIEQMMYEGYGPGGVAILIEAATDNRKRSVSQIKNVLERSGGTLASPGAVRFQFNRRGLLTVPKQGIAFDALLTAACDAGAEDVVETTDLFEVYTNDADLSHVKQALAAARIPIEKTVRIMHAISQMEAGDALRAKTDDLVAALEELDDVQTVFTNLT
ncbi:MAG: YebC/PmpR family DNA-binding transcriptional regulator [Candidatus Gottesmanbacteria bacterium]|nr:YebC/PmpR family DNA-binding transcriptional regulator [Candidatus Gottesmanbacteria bacterium]